MMTMIRVLFCRHLCLQPIPDHDPPFASFPSLCPPFVSLAFSFSPRLRQPTRANHLSTLLNLADLIKPAPSVPDHQKFPPQSRNFYSPSTQKSTPTQFVPSRRVCIAASSFTMQSSM